MNDISQNLNNATIMIIDDEPMTMAVVQAFLEDSGYSRFVQVEESSRGILAIEEKNPDILLLDLVMPGVSGFDILKQVREHPKYCHLPVIILTASSDSENKLRALDLGATDFLAKPVDQSELGLRVRNTLAAKAYADQLAYYDPLTKLPNKHMFSGHFEWALKKAKRHEDHLALLSISLDNLAMINATIGVGPADQVLQLVSDRLESIVREIDVMSRSTGDHKTTSSLFRVESTVFSILLDNMRGVEDAALVAERILQSVKKPIEVEGIEIYPTVSIGIASYPEEGKDCVTLERLATSAKDYTKKKGGNKFHFSSNAINESYAKRLRWESKLRRALEADEFVLYYQPKVDVKTGVIRGVEALIRWQSKAMGLVPPNDFIPLAEETGLIVPIGQWVIEEACNRLAAWNKQGRGPLVMAINLSVKQLEGPEIFSTIEKIIADTGVDPQFLKFEITESLLLDNIENKIALLKRLKKLGLSLSIDDFGTGYSSLSYLAKMPVDELKVDRSFIMDMLKDEENHAIVSSVIFLAKNLGLMTVAEGVETKEQLRYLQDQNCDQYQGFYFSRPIPEAELLELIPVK